MANFVCTSKSVGSYRVSETAFIVTSKWYKPDGTRRGIIYCHGAGGGADGTNSKANALALAGYPVLVADLCAAAYSFNNWANADAISAMGAAWTYLTGTVGAKDDAVGLFGGSMGAATGLAWARANLTDVFAAAFVIPVLDIDDIYQNNKGSNRASIGTAYGVTYPTSLGDLSTHSPVAFGSNDLASLPLNLYPSSDDPVASNTAACQSWGGKGAALTVIDQGAIGHTSSVPDQTIVQFFDDNGGRS